MILSAKREDAGFIPGLDYIVRSWNKIQRKEGGTLLTTTAMAAKTSL